MNRSLIYPFLHLYSVLGSKAKIGCKAHLNGEWQQHLQSIAFTIRFLNTKRAEAARSR